MNDFSFVIHTPVYVGPECMKKNAAVLKQYGNRAYVITSSFGEYRHYSLEDIKAALEEQGIEYRCNESVQVNPPVESIREIADDCRAYQPDFLVAVGGGAALDSAKAVSVLLPHPDEDPYQVFWEGGTSAAGRHPTLNNETRIPIIAAPTTAGTGSEVSAASVLTRADLDTKVVIYQNVFCELAFLDPRYIQDSPRDLLYAGVLDALCHTVESYLNVKSNLMTRAMGEVGMRLFAGFKDRLLSRELTQEDYQNMLIASYFDGIAFQCGTGLPHGMGYPLSHHKGVLHGLACGVFLGEYLRAFQNKSLVDPIVSLCGFRDVDGFARYIQQFVRENVSFSVTEEEVQEYAQLFCRQEAHRLARHPEKIGQEEITEIYRRSLAPYVKADKS